MKPPINNLQNHKENTHGQAKVKCDMCGKMFKTKQTMRRHVEILHLGLKKHECEICGEKLKVAYSQKVVLSLWTHPQKKCAKIRKFLCGTYKGSI